MNKRHKGETEIESHSPSDHENTEKNTEKDKLIHGPKFRQLSSEQKQQLIRMHSNLGHPDSVMLGNVLRD